MAEQSPVQQLIQSLAGIQTTAQQNASNAANNGNPNTVYNTSAWGYGGPPVMDSNGAWSTNQFSPAAVLQAQNLNFGSWQPPAGTGSTTGGGWGNLRPVLPPNIADPNWVAPPVTTPPGGGGTTTPPTTTPPTGGGGTPVTGGPLVPGGSTQGGNNNGSVLIPGNANNGGPSGSLNLGGGGTQGGGGNFSSIGQWLGNGATGRMIGANGDGSISWQQVVDLVTEPWLQGNLYMSQTGKWNPQNVLTTLVNAIAPGGGSLLNFLAEKGLFGNRAREWVLQGQYAELGNEVLGFLRNQYEFEEEDNPVRSVVEDMNNLIPNTPFGNFGPNYLFGNGWSSGLGTPVVNVGNATPLDPNVPIVAEGPWGGSIDDGGTSTDGTPAGTPTGSGPTAPSRDPRSAGFLSDSQFNAGSRNMLLDALAAATGTGGGSRVGKSIFANMRQ